MEMPLKFGILSGAVFVFITIFGWVAFPALMKYGIKHQMTLQPGTELRDMWSNLPFSIDFKVYIFNVTNAKDVMNGDTPVLDEIGPFVFDEWKSKVDLVDDETNDTVEFNAKTRWFFNQERSGNLTGDEIVTIPHPMIMSMLLVTARDRTPFLQLAYRAARAIFDNPSSIFLKARVKDILFDGIYINCNQSDFIAQTACMEMKEEKTLKHVGNDGLLFSFFGYKNSSVENRMKVKRGKENYLDLNRVVEYMNETEMDVWPTEECNQLRGTESSVYHPLIHENEALSGFVPLLCRALNIVYVGKSSLHDFSTLLYTTSFGDMSKNKYEKCYCPKENSCLKKGTADLLKCTGAPIAVTFPHFYDADESYLEGVRGLRPSAEKHRSEFHFEPFTGVILRAVNRLQFNFQLQRLKNITIMETVPESMFPVLWIEEAVELNSTYLHNLDKQVFLLMRINKSIKWTILLLSTAGIILAVYMSMNKKRGFSLGKSFPSKKDELNEPNKNGGKNSLGMMGKDMLSS